MPKLCAILLLLVANIAPAAEPAMISPELARTLMNIMARAEEDVEGALADLKELAERRRRSRELPFILRQRAVLLLQEERYDTARAEILQAIEGRPEDYAPMLRFLLGQIYLLEDRAELAVEELTAWADNTVAPDASGLFMLGYAYVRLERFEEAALALERTLEAAADIRIRPRWVEVLAYVYTQLGRTSEAIDLLRSLVRDHPQESRWWRQLSAVFLLIDDIPQGTAGLTIASGLEEDMELADARRLARLFGYLGIPADGATLLEEALKQSGEVVEFDDAMLLAELNLMAREFEPTLAALTSAAALATDGEPLMIMGQLYLQRERYAEAKDVLVNSLADYGETAPPLLHYLLAVTHLNLGELDDAERSIVSFETDPDYGRRAGPLREYLRNERRAAL